MGLKSEREAIEKQVNLVMSPGGQFLASIFLRDLSGDFLKGKKLDRIRQNNYASMSGNVLHIGTGHGTNDVPNFPRSGINELVGIDIVPRPKYLENIKKHGGIGEKRFVVGDARDPEVFSGLGQQFDHVAIAFLLCLFDPYEHDQ